jgi:hypothetical protein
MRVTSINISHLPARKIKNLDAGETEAIKWDLFRTKHFLMVNGSNDGVLEDSGHILAKLICAVRSASIKQCDGWCTELCVLSGALPHPRACHILDSCLKIVLYLCGLYPS